MSECCSPETSSADRLSGNENKALCPECGQKGLKVKPVTLQSLLKSGVGLDQRFEQFRFCRTEDCEVAYFGQDNSIFLKEQVKVPIFQKDLSEEARVCYCFDVSRKDVMISVAQGEGMRIYDEIKHRKETEGCDCETLNPQGSCCFGNVKNLIKSYETVH